MSMVSIRYVECVRVRAFQGVVDIAEKLIIWLVSKVNKLM
jgi:hypothetical protein